MIPINLKIDNRKQEIDIPASWDELSYSQAVALSKIDDPENHLQLVHVVSGIDMGIIESMDAGVFNKILGYCLEIFTDSQPDFSELELPKAIHIRGKEINTDLNPATMFAASMWSIQEQFRGKSNDEIAQSLHTIIAHSVAKNFHEKYDEEQISYLEAEISNFPAFIVYPVGVFFSQKLSIHLMEQQGSLEKILLKRRSMQRLKELKSSGRFSRFIHYVKGIGQRQRFTKAQNTEQ